MEEVAPWAQGISAQDTALSRRTEWPQATVHISGLWFPACEMSSQPHHICGERCPVDGSALPMLPTG